MLDEEHPVLPAADPQDTNVYRLGRIGSHNVVIACLPAEKTGKVSAAIVAKDLLRSFKAVRFGLMVGVGGRALYYNVKHNNSTIDVDCKDSNSAIDIDCEDEEDNSKDTQDIRLGDVVISLHSKSSEAVVQYDFRKSVQGKDFIHTSTLNKPLSIVLSAVSMLQGQYAQRGHKLSEQLSKIVSDNPCIATKFEYPGLAKDQLFKSNFVHLDDKKKCKDCYSSLNVNLVKRKKRDSTNIVLHYGTIGSAD
jgi:hypothetical protein